MANGHARLSSSGTKQWAICPGSAALLADEESSSGAAAMMGTCAHALAERCLTQEIDAESALGMKAVVVFPDTADQDVVFYEHDDIPRGTPQAHIFPVDEDMVTAVGHYLEYVRGRIADTGGDYFIEVKVTPLASRDDTGGTADFVLDNWLEGEIEITDYKNGSGVFVPVEDNYQLRSYAIGYLDKIGIKTLADAAKCPYTIVRMTIVQPRHYKAPENGVMTTTIPIGELMEWKEWLEDRAHAVDHARSMVDRGCGIKDLFEAELISVGEDGAHCAFCPLQATCPAHQAKVCEAAAMDFDDEPEELSVPASNEMDELAKALKWVPFIENWASAVRSRALGQMTSGAPLPGFKLVHGKSNRTWVNQVNLGTEDEPDLVEFTPKLVEAILHNNFGIKDASKLIYTEPGLKTGPQIEKLIPAKKRKEFSALMMYKPEGKLNVVPDSDPKTAVDCSAAADFEDEEL